MTTDQINYWKNVEQRRSNLAMEAETRRANRARELETYRANLAKERELNRINTINAKIAQYGHGISDQHYIRSDALSARKLDQEKRLALEQLKEQQRSNVARETETHRTNVAQEKLKQSQISNLWSNTSLETARLAELQRSNRAQEHLGLINLTEQGRANQAREFETNRSNLAQEGFKIRQIGIDQQKANEIHRANVMGETLRSREQWITMRGQNFNLAGNLTNSFTKMLTPSVRSTKGALIE